MKRRYTLIGIDVATDIKPDIRMDLRETLCPMNFVKTKLKLEEMAVGQILEIIIDEGEPISNVPRSIKDEGHRILSVERFENAFKLLIERR